MFREPLPTAAVPVGDAWIALAITCAICLWLLSKRVKAFEVVK